MRYVLLFVGMLGLGCRPEGEPDYAFPDGLEPLEANQASWPADQAETIQTALGEVEDAYHWAHARAYVHAPIDDVYACLQEENVNVDRREVNSWTLTGDVEAGYEHSYAIKNFVENIVNLEFTDTWRHGSTLDEDGARVLTTTVWKMTEGNNYMYLKEGSIVAEAASDTVTSLEMVGHLSAALRDAETMETYLVDLYEDVKACVSGSPYPTFN